MDGMLQTVTHYDQLGRVNLVQKSDGAPLNGDADGIKVLTLDTYPSSGRRVVTSTPYRNTDYSDSTLEWTCTQYDQLNRVAAVAMFKGAAAPNECVANNTNRTGITTTQYDSEWTIVTDPAGKVRKQKRDGLGRLVQVIEDPSGLNYSTTYGYDALDNLTGVTQGAQTRTFVYSSLSRLSSAANPESGTISYTYYDSGDLKRRTDARSKWSESAYDPLHRILTKTYSDSTPAVTYEYYLAGSSSSPNIGQLKSVISSVASTTYNSYSQLGNVMTSTNTINGYSGNLTFNYDWYLNGGLKRIQYPSGRQASYDVDDAGRSNKVYATGKTYADMTGITYPFTPDGRITQMKLGNDLWETHDYNTPGTTTVYKLGTVQGSGNLLQLEYNFSGTNNNGNLSSQVISRPGNVWQQSFYYDNVNRLSTAIEPGLHGWTRTYGYDQYGNRWVQISTGLAHSDPKEPVAQSNFSASTNRLTTTGMQYDSAGNQTKYGVFTLGYDAESRNTSATSTGSGSGSFVYDGEGRRVKKVWTPSVGPVVTTYFVYNALGQLAAEYSSEAPTSLGTSYPFTDMLGSVRAITSDSQAVVECYDYLPFGRMLSSLDNGRNIGCYPTDPDTQFTSRIPQKFTSKERDAETGLDFFLARYYSGAQGRFTSVDPVIITPGRMRDPQQLNRYSYVRNNPLKYIDPDGEKLFLSGDIDAAKAELCKIIGGNCQRIEYDEKNKTITVDIGGLEGNEGAMLLDEVANDKKVNYGLTLGEEMATKGGMLPLKGSKVNLDNMPDWRYGKGKSGIDLPPSGLDAALGLNLNAGYIYRSEESGDVVPAYRLIYHELAEAVAKVKGMPYIHKGEKMPGTGAHNEAKQRERRLPNVKSEGLAGDQLIRDPK
jgi:RHS repeat-associated protein